MEADDVDIIYDLTYLRNIKLITGALIVQEIGSDLQSLSFLQNLETVENIHNESYALEITDVSWNDKKLLQLDF